MKRLTMVITLIGYLAAAQGLTFAQSRPNSRSPFAPLDKATAPKSAKIIKSVQDPVAPEDPEALQLQGILWNSSNPVAIIDYSVVTVGSIIMGRKVVAITADHVEVEYLKKKETLTMAPKILFSVTVEKTESDGRAEGEQED